MFYRPSAQWCVGSTDASLSFYDTAHPNRGRQVAALGGLIEDDKANYCCSYMLSDFRCGTLCAWWQALSTRIRKQVFNMTLHQYGEPPVQCEPWIMRRFITRALQTPCMFVVLGMADIMALRTKYNYCKPTAPHNRMPGMCSTPAIALIPSPHHSHQLS
jgi:hypothetical protein